MGATIALTVLDTAWWGLCKVTSGRVLTWIEGSRLALPLRAMSLFGLEGLECASSLIDVSFVLPLSASFNISSLSFTRLWSKIGCDAGLSRDSLVFPYPGWRCDYWQRWASRLCTPRCIHWRSAFCPFIQVSLKFSLFKFGLLTPGVIHWRTVLNPVVQFCLNFSLLMCWCPRSSVKLLVIP